MNEHSDRQHAVELLQQLGLKEYEAKCFVALARMPHGTAKSISEHSDVPRTRVYEAVRVLESKGLVEIQHSSPQQFRAVPIAEAAETLRQEFQERTESLVEAVEAIEPAPSDEEREVTHEVWAMSGPTAIATRTRELIGEAEREVVLVVGNETVLTEDLLARLQAASEDDTDVLVGARTELLAAQVEATVPEAQVFVSGLEWLDSSPVDPSDDTTISRLLLVDGSAILVSTDHESPQPDAADEMAVFGRGFDNGIVAVARRLMATGLPEGADAE